MNQKPCPQCQQALPAEVLFCTHCGWRFAPPTGATPVQPSVSAPIPSPSAVPPGHGTGRDSKGGRAKIVIISVGILLILALAGAAAWFLLREGGGVGEDRYEAAGISCAKTEVDIDEWKDLYLESGYSETIIEEAARVANSGGAYECTYQGRKYDRYSEDTYQKVNDIFFDEALSELNRLGALGGDQKEFLCSLLADVNDRTVVLAGRDVFSVGVEELKDVDVTDLNELLTAGDIGDLKRALEEAGIETASLELEFCQ